jgi:hypothetical protein
MSYLDNILFALLLVIGFGYFFASVKKIKRNINLGIDVDRKDNPKARWKNMAMIAMGQSKMVKRRVAGIMHVIVYVGFIIINIELLEIIIDGLFGTHRVFAFLGSFYDVLIASFEILAVLVLLAVVVFWLRRNVIKLKRFINKDLSAFSKNDANYILYFEVVLMTLFLLMNATDLHLQNVPGGFSHFIKAGSYPISQFIAPLFNGMSNETVMILFEASWWLHIVGILIFMNYLYFSKHLHILLAFPNTYFADLNPQGQFDNLETTIEFHLVPKKLQGSLLNTLRITWKC